MGVGKTLMCLTLICATLHQPCMPAAEEYDITNIITNVRLRDYGFDDDRKLRAAVGQDEPRHYPRVDLKEFCADILVTTNAAIRHAEIPKHLHAHLDRHAMYYSRTLHEDSCRRTVKQLPLDRPPDIQKIYLANTTLIVVPKMLVDQWEHEVAKHVEESALNVLVVRREMPGIKALMGYDVCLP